MKKRILIPIGIGLVGIVLILALRSLVPALWDRSDKATSDAAGTKGTITIGVDNWVGYFPLCSPRMKQAMRNEGYLLKCEDDGADYPGRMKRLKRGELDFAVATVDSYLINGEPVRFPGAIVSVIDESKGGDAIVAYEAAVANLQALKGTVDVRVAFTPDSPSHHLLKTAGAHFDIPTFRNLRGDARIETDGSEGALSVFKKKGAEVAVLWEPDVSRALELDGVTKLLGTENTSRVIVDILIAERDFIAGKGDVVSVLLSTYYRTLKYYRDNEEEFIEDVHDETGIRKDKVKNMLDGVAWVNLTDNCSQWFGVRKSGQMALNGLAETIESTIEVLRENGDFDRNPLPDEDPARITNRAFVEQLCQQGVRSGFGGGAPAPGAIAPVGSLEARFDALDEAKWAALQEVGTMKVEPIVFQSGNNGLTLQGKEQLDKIVDRLKHYPTFRVLVKGHTGVRGDPEANKLLSQERAESVVRYIQVTYGVDKNRIRAVGLGGGEPLRREPGESDRSWKARLSRVEVSLLQEVF